MDLDNLDTFRIATCDLNGQMRGKRMLQKDQRKLASGDLRMPLSVLNVDIWGADIINSPLLFASGDGDGYLLPTNRGPVPMPWLDQPSALVGMWMFEEDGRPFEGDPRHALAQILDRYAARGWQVMADASRPSGTSYASGTQATGKPPHGGAHGCLHQSSPAADRKSVV